ncbi:MAG: glycosyltransferase family 2 protein [Desulfobacter sp.]|nr:MAG: glycosyltransferase family 2 protein [Desulfobacter sp.]
MRASVIVTTYNRPDALKKVLDGLLGQTCLPHDIIVADDGSGPQTEEMLSPYLARQDISISHVWQADEGFRAARIRNKAVLAAEGDYLILLDGDCIPERHFVADHMALARPGSFFQGKRVLVNEKQVEEFDHRDMGSLLRLMGLVLGKDISNGHHIVRVPFLPAYTVKKLSGIRSCNMGIFREDMVAVNGFNQAFVGWGREDTEFVVRLFRYGLTRREHPFRAICYHLWHRENSRDKLEENDALLEISERSETYYCRLGLDSLAASDEDAGAQGYDSE